MKTKDRSETTGQESWNVIENKLVTHNMRESN
jgi:hypothetical protein